jgi:hypothetical protein
MSIQVRALRRPTSNHDAKINEGHRMVSSETIAALQTYARQWDPAGGGCELIASTPTSLTELASLRLAAVD